MSEEKVPKRQYSEQFKAEAARLAASVGSHEAARRLGVPMATVGNWARRRRSPATAEPGAPTATAVRRPVTELEAEVSRLRKELASAKLDIEVPRKATAYFAS